ncbi:MAG: hypothetical protein P8J37_21895 [Fuerstiella sp.]|nr:hypothetical protein [Fuerstiella sp.]
MVACCALTASVCVLGPKSLQHSRLNYNRAIQTTSREELLLNLVRMRYHESEEFLGVSSITGQYTYNADLTGAGIWPGGAKHAGAAKLGATSKPTIVYSPEQGKDFNQRKLSPVSLETLDLLASKGWAIDRVLRLTVRNLNDIDNATSAGGPTPTKKPEYEEFLYLAQLFRQLKTPNSRRLIRHGLEPGTPIALKDEVTMSTRSLKEMMFYLSHAVGAPAEHYRCGYVRSTFDDYGKPFNWNDMTAGLFHVHYSKKRPVDADVAVKHRGYWFYESNCDLDSKSTLNLLSELINLEIRAGGGAQIPLLTI